MIIARSPFRITLGGGGTDLPSFYKLHGGFVCTMAIDKYIYVNLKPSVLDTKVRLQYLQPEVVNNCTQLKHRRAAEALKMHNLYHSIEINSIADLPASSGLGSSGSYLVGLLNAIRHYKRLSCAPEIIAAEACNIEIDIMKEPVGKQDQYIASHGGMRILDINKEGIVNVRNMNAPISAINSLLSNIHIYYTGILRNASDILKKQNEITYNIEDKLKKIKELGYEFVASIEEQNFDNFGLLLDEHWKLKKQLSNKISLCKVDSLYEEVKERFGVLGGKIIGAGGGGFLMLYTPQKHFELEAFMQAAEMPRLNYSIDPHGSKIVADLRTTNTFDVVHDLKGLSKKEVDLWKYRRKDQK
jgi:D-glycero-alpha-D-manno-heptose-7-phosphate kinase